MFREIFEFDLLNVNKNLSLFTKFYSKQNDVWNHVLQVINKALNNVTKWMFEVLLMMTTKISVWWCNQYNILFKYHKQADKLGVWWSLQISSDDGT